MNGAIAACRPKFTCREKTVGWLKLDLTPGVRFLSNADCELEGWMLTTVKTDRSIRVWQGALLAPMVDLDSSTVEILRGYKVIIQKCAPRCERV
jgi:hypothetical protein